MTYTFKQLSQESKGKAIYSYCKFMNCFGQESRVDSFLEDNKNIMFTLEGKLVLNK
jgi:hypothetical protein